MTNTPDPNRNPERDIVERLLKVEPDEPGDRTRWYRNPDGPDAAEEITRLRAEKAELVEAANRIRPYLRWTISDESPGHHPTMPSALAAFEETIRTITAQQEGTQMKTVIEEIDAERQRQINVEGWTPEHDDTHVNGEMAHAAAAYAEHGARPDQGRQYLPGPPIDWPWDFEWWKPKDRRHDLIRAAALIVAEIERLDRRSQQEGDGDD